MLQNWKYIVGYVIYSILINCFVTYPIFAEPLVVLPANSSDEVPTEKLEPTDSPPEINTKANPSKLQSFLTNIDPLLEVISAVQGAYGSGMDGVTIPSRLNLGFTYTLPVDVFSFIFRITGFHGRHNFGRTRQLLPLNDIAIIGINDWMARTDDFMVYRTAERQGVIHTEAAYFRIFPKSLGWMEWVIGFLNPRRWDRFDEGSTYSQLIMSGNYGFIAPYFTRLAPIYGYEHEYIPKSATPKLFEDVQAKIGMPGVAFRLDPWDWFTFRALLTIPKIWYHLWVRNSGIIELTLRPNLFDKHSAFQLTWALADDHDSQLHRMAYSMAILIEQELASNFFVFGRYSVSERSGVQTLFGTYRFQWQAGMAFGLHGSTPKDYQHYWAAGVAQVAKIDQEGTEPYAYLDPETYMEGLYRLHIFQNFFASLHVGLLLNQYWDSKDLKLLMISLRVTHSL